MTETDRVEALAAHRKIGFLWRSIGALGPALRKAKPGSKLHAARWNRLVTLENEAAELSSKIDMFILLVGNKQL